MANSTGSFAVPPLSETVFMVSVSAVASTSAGAPWLTCSASVALESNASFTFTLGWSFSKSLASVVNVSVNEAAPSTVSVVLSLLLPLLSDPPPQPARRSASTAMNRNRVDFFWFLMAAPR